MKRPLPLEVLRSEGSETGWDALATSLHAAARRDLWYWAEYPLTLPPTAFLTTDAGSSMEALFQAPTPDELDEVARSPDGNLRRLSTAQRDQIRAEGQFAVASVRYPGQQHVWALSGLLQRGRRAIATRFRQRIAAGIRQGLVLVPRRLWGEGGEGPSVWAGLRHLRRMVRNLVGLGIGLPVLEARWSAWALDAAGAQDRRASVLSDDASLDLALDDPALLDRARPVLETLTAQALAAWQAVCVDRQRNLDAALRAEGLADTALRDAVARALEDAQREAFLEHIAASPALDALHPGFGARFAARARAQALLGRLYQDRQAVYHRRRAETQARLQQAHPVRSLIPEWLEARAAVALGNTPDDEAAAIAEAAETLRAQGDAQEARVFARSAAYAREQAPGVRAQRAAERVPTRNFTWLRRRWHRRDWTSERVRPEAWEVDPPLRYRLVRDDAFVVTTATVGWRLANLWHRTVFLLHNGLWHLVDNALHGPVGLRALFTTEPFAPTVEVDAETGVVGPVAWRRLTLVARLRALWKGVRNARRAFEALPDTGIVGKTFSRILDRVWNYLLKGALGTLVLGVAQPLATLVTLAATLALVVSAPLWAPLLALGVYLFNLLVHDTEHAGRGYRTLPLVTTVLGHGVLAGVGQIAVALLGALVVHPAIAVLWWLAAFVRGGLRSTYDAVVFGLVVRPLGRIPASDSPLARRIEGPGLSSSYYFQAPPALILIALQGTLEREALTAYQRRTETELRAPEELLQRFVSQMAGPFVASPMPADALAQPIAESTARHIDALTRALDDRQALLTRLSTVPDAERVRLTRDDLGQTLARATELVAEFVPRELLAPCTETERVAFWADRGLPPDDMAGLTRQLLEQSLSPGLLVPLEDNDRALRLMVKPLDLASYLGALKKASPLGSALEYAEAPPLAWAPTPSPVQRLDAMALIQPMCPLGEYLRVPARDDAARKP